MYWNFNASLTINFSTKKVSSLSQMSGIDSKLLLKFPISFSDMIYADWYAWTVQNNKRRTNLRLKKTNWDSRSSTKIYLISYVSIVNLHFTAHFQNVCCRTCLIINLKRLLVVASSHQDQYRMRYPLEWVGWKKNNNTRKTHE